MSWSQPETAQIRAALREYAPQLAEERIEFLGEGWSMWAFRAGDHVLRFPKTERDAAEFKLERQLLPELARHVSTQVSMPDVSGVLAPGGAPFSGYRYIDGVSLIGAAEVLPAAVRDGRPDVRLAATFGRELGAFLRELHAFPVSRALELGVPLRDGPALRQYRMDFYERVIRDVFPLVSCEAREYSTQRFETYLNDPATFDFQPVLVHNDLDRQNVIVDPATGSLAGVIDWGGAVVGDPAADLWLALFDFEQLGIGDQIPDFLNAYVEVPDMDRVQVQVQFIQFLWPFHDILFGKWQGDSEFVEAGILALNASLPPDLRC